MATLVLVPLLISFGLLAPAIVLGYAVKAAERDDHERRHLSARVPRPPLPSVTIR